MLLAGGVIGHGKRVKSARYALTIGIALLLLIVAFQVISRINNAMAG